MTGRGAFGGVRGRPPHRGPDRATRANTAPTPRASPTPPHPQPLPPQPRLRRLQQPLLPALDAPEPQRAPSLPGAPRVQLGPQQLDRRHTAGVRPERDAAGIAVDFDLDIGQGRLGRVVARGQDAVGAQLGHQVLAELLGLGRADGDPGDAPLDLGAATRRELGHTCGQVGSVCARVQAGENAAVDGEAGGGVRAGGHGQSVGWAEPCMAARGISSGAMVVRRAAVRAQR